MIKTIVKWLLQEELTANQQRDIDMLMLNVKLVIITAILGITLFIVLVKIVDTFASAEQYP